jgi:hypothetical protein
MAGFFSKTWPFLSILSGFCSFTLTCFKTSQIRQVVLALPRAAFVAGLVFAAFQNMWAAASNRRRDDIAPALTDR